ncbi:MAG TPA: preprotein translocase subunit SecE [Candidatus Pacearchaeota archaeon]|nr:preprotein translocase subunit SecE [Candidatus Pacearchaeota archaeon]HOK94114.1 preprotein translocase subunit SecE [Candidatus Pacearchaeota archaeon]HPO75242.1 preprotein translocase subunit SecE [Candidatus Pacearchaeota archaeon]
MNINNFFKKIPKFFSEVKAEMKKVSWPTREETLKNTLIVIGTSVVTAIFLGGLDAFFTWIMSKII